MQRAGAGKEQEGHANLMTLWDILDIISIAFQFKKVLNLLLFSTFFFSMLIMKRAYLCIEHLNRLFYYCYIGVGEMCRRL